MRARTFFVCAYVCTDLHKIGCQLLSYMCLSLKFHKDPSFRCKDIGKISTGPACKFLYVLCLSGLFFEASKGPFIYYVIQVGVGGGKPKYETL